MNRRRRSRVRDERGYVLVLAAVTMVALLGFSAFAVDLGALYNARRQDQSAADTAALGAAIDLGVDAATIASAIDLVNRTLPAGLDPAAFDTCANEIVPAGMLRAPGADCISWNRIRSRVRVRVPLQQLTSSFAGVVGVESFQHTAVAEAEVVTIGQGNILPFAVFAGSGTYECLKMGADNVPDPLCEGAASGNFRMLNFSWHGDDGEFGVGTTQDCGIGNEKARFVNNVAVGIDHMLSAYGGPPHDSPVTEVLDSTCGAIPRPNATDTLTGNIPDEAGRGLFSGTGFTDGGPARLARQPLFPWGRQATVSGYRLDDNPLWEFISPNLAGRNVPRSCWRDQFVGETGGMNTENDRFMSSLPDPIEAHTIDMPRRQRMVKLLERCFTHYRGLPWDDHGALDPPEQPVGCIGACSDPVFGRNTDLGEEPDLWDIQGSPRFGYVPELWQEDVDSSGSTTVQIRRFRAMFLQRLYGGICNPRSCAIEFDPGVPETTGGTGTKANAMTAFLFPDAMLPGGLGRSEAANAIGFNRFVQLVE